MILIISENSDESTIDVINWLMFYDLSFTRINSDDVLELFSTKSGFYLLNKENKITIKNVSSCWFRRGFLNVRSNNLINNKYFQEEEYWYKDYIYYLLEQKKSISSYRKMHYNKLIVNKIASNFGIKIPNFIISNFKKDIPNEKKHITKTINGLGVVDFSENFKGFLYTKFIDKNTIPNKFHLSLIQEYVEKKYELRIFYLHERFWSMAIFSQKDERTKVDFRNYNKEKPNRTIPYKLPKKIEQKLHLLMKALDLNSGSIDMIVTPKDEYYFLEVNPIGQFGMVSFPCNYHLEKEIAHILSK